MKSKFEQFAAKAIITLNSKNRHSLEIRSGVNVKIRFFIKLCTQRKIFTNKQTNKQTKHSEHRIHKSILLLIVEATTYKRRQPIMSDR